MSIAQTVESYLSERQVPYETRHHRASTSSLASARSAHVDEDYVAKSVVLQDEQGFLLVVLPASRRLEFDRLRVELGRSLRLTNERDVAKLFPDCEVGAVPPVGAAYGLPTVLDASLEECDEIYFEGGDHETLVRLERDAFLDLLENASVAEVATESSSLRAALVLRERLYDTVLSLSRAITAPVASGKRWRRRMSDALARVDRALDEHIAESEGEDGVLGEIINQAPRLRREVSILQSEHVELSEACRRLQLMIQSDASELALRRRAHDLCVRFGEHRYRGADLVYDAFDIDLGGG